MSKTIKPADLGKAISAELSIYHENVVEGVNKAGASAIKKLVKKTRAKAPVKTGDFKKSITSKALPATNGLKNFVLFAKPPLHRIFHLLVNGHAKLNGGRVPGDPFLGNALAEVLPEYGEDVKEAIKNG